MRQMMVCVAFALAACASSGTKFAMADIERMQPGVTTEQEAVQKIGKPTNTRFNPDGSKVLVWVWAHAVPGKATSRGASTLFDKEGRFVRIVSKSEIN